MQESSSSAANEQGGSADYWTGFQQTYWDTREEIAFLRDAMQSGHGNGSSETTPPPRGLRYMDDAHAVGLLLAGEVTRDY